MLLGDACAAQRASVETLRALRAGGHMHTREGHLTSAEHDTEWEKEGIDGIKMQQSLAIVPNPIPQCTAQVSADHTLQM